MILIKFHSLLRSGRRENINPNLVRPGNVGLGLPEHEEREHGHAVEYPDREAEEVYEALNVAAKDHHLGDKSLEKEGFR